MKKLLSMVLALMMCLSMLPAMAEYGVIGGADGPTEVFVTSAVTTMTLPGDLAAQALAAGRRVESEWKITEMTGIDLDDEALTSAVQELVEAITLRAANQGDEYSCAVSIGQTDVLTFDLANMADEYFVHSNLLGSPIAFRADEGSAIFTRLTDAMVQYGLMTEDTAAIYEELLATYAQEDVQENIVSAFTLEELLTLDYSAVISALSALNDRIELVEAPTVPGNCDPAAIAGKLSVTNEQMAQVCKAYIQLLRDNPTLMNLVAEMTGAMTQEQASAMADMYAVDVSFLQFMTIEYQLEQLETELDSTPILDGTFDIYLCMNEAGELVYLTATMPIYTASASLEGEETTASVEGEVDAEADASTEIIASPSADMIAEQEAEGTSTVVALEYRRQTVAEGVSHVVNLFVDEESLTIDALVKDSSARVLFTEQEKELCVLDLTWTDSTFSALLTIEDGSSTVSFAFDGAYVCTDEAYTLAGTLTITNASAISGERLTLGFQADYTRNGADFVGACEMVFAFEDLFDESAAVRIRVQGTSCTADPVESIVTADALRPADMDDETFTQWFSTVINTMNGWTGTVLMALPESLLTIILSSGI